MGLITKSFEIPMLISVQDFKDRVKAYPVQPGIMKTVPFPMNGFLIEQIGENDFEVARETYTRQAIIHAKVVIEPDGDGWKVKVVVWQDWRSLIIPFLVLLFGWVSAIVRLNDSTRFGIGLLVVVGAIPFLIARISWHFSLPQFRRWLKDGLMAP